MKGINVLSVCDGMSCAQIALRELGIKYDGYFASEIDRHAIGQTRLNFPDTVQLGDIEKWREWNIDWPGIDIIFAGTPCTGFSAAGKGLGFNDPQSRLFFAFSGILNHIRAVNPDVLFLLENVRMKRCHLRVISEAVGVYPVLINSARVSAQNRLRCYWSNIRKKQATLFKDMLPETDIPQPRDRGIFLRDILEEKVDGKYILRGKTLARILRENPATDPDKSRCVTPRSNTTGYGNKGTMTVVSVHEKKRKKQNMDLIRQLNRSEEWGTTPRQENRIYGIEGKSPTLMARRRSAGSPAILQGGHGVKLRRLTPAECARLQTIPAWYKWECGEFQQYKMLGNGWTIEVIKHILSYLPDKFFNK